MSTRVEYLKAPLRVDDSLLSQQAPVGNGLCVAAGLDSAAENGDDFEAGHGEIEGISG